MPGSEISTNFLREEIIKYYKVEILLLGMRKEFVTTNFKQTQKLGELLAQELKGGTVICLTGELGSGKTTFTQGLLKGLKVKGPYTSPTFVIMKKYKKNIFHFDVYRVSAKDILNLGWEEIIRNKNNIVIIEWADRIKKIVPNPPDGGVLWIKFEWMDEKKRKIAFSPKSENNN